MSAVALVLLAVAAVVVALTVAWCVSRARRLDRLHVRLDAARAGLVAALDRRAAVAVRIAGLPAMTNRAGAPGVNGAGPAAADGPLSRAGELLAAARAATATRLGSREAPESALTRQLAAVDRTRLDSALYEELVDAEQLVVLARRVHNDAVRDTLALRSRRLVRWLRLAGTAPEPMYFDIAEPEPAFPASHQVPT